MNRFLTSNKTEWRLAMAVLSPIMGAISSNGETIEAYVGGEAAGNTETEHEKEDPADAPEEEEAL